MSQSLAKVLLHIVFSTKDRRPWLDDELRPRMHAYLASACRAQGCEALRIGGAEDHVHIACVLSRTLSISKLVEEIKVSSSAWAKTQGRKSSSFVWQAGYGAFSLGQSQVAQLVQYIDSQAEHHRTRDFRNEFLALLQLYEAEYNEVHLWD